MMENINKVLVLAPHTDDGELGAGAFINKLISEGKDVYYAAFSTAEQSVPPQFPKDILKTEVKNATEVLGIKHSNLFVYNYEVRKLSYVRQEILEEMVKLRSEINFDLIVMPCLHDIHQDHATIANEAVRAFRNATLLGYELIWNNLAFNAQCFIRLKKENVDNKISALKEYHSQGRHDYLSGDFIYSLARTRGIQAGCEYAEAFEVVRLFL